jgi:DNA (cytosine-5)-methyltransferase 1
VPVAGSLPTPCKTAQHLLRAVCRLLARLHRETVAGTPEPLAGGGLVGSPRVLALFAGGGGLEMAVEMLWPDAELVAYSEFDPHASSVFSRWKPDVPNLGDITKIDWNDVPPVDIVTAGFPCQDISHAGKRAGIKEGTRSGLWFSVADCLRVLRPRLALLENVAAITSGGGGLDVVLGSLAEDGWDAEWGVLRASDVGATHGRARWFCAAYPRGSGAGWDGGAIPRTAEGLRRSCFDVHAAVDACAVATDTCSDRLVRSKERNLGSQQPGQPTPQRSHPDRLDLDDAGTTRWGDYEPAIRQWEQTLGRSAPRPTDVRGRLSPPFVEWMMGWPEGHIDNVNRTQALKVLGNGVVPLQAATAYSQLLDRIEAAAEVAA